MKRTKKTTATEQPRMALETPAPKSKDIGMEMQPYQRSLTGKVRVNLHPLGSNGPAEYGFSVNIFCDQLSETNDILDIPTFNVGMRQWERSTWTGTVPSIANTILRMVYELAGNRANIITVRLSHNQYVSTHVYWKIGMDLPELLIREVQRPPYTLPAGQYKGKKLDEVNPHYLYFLSNHRPAWCDLTAVNAFIAKHLNAFGQQRTTLFAEADEE